MRVGRNEACPCGSGRKFKSCCEGKESRGWSKGLIILLVAIGAIAAVGIIPSFLPEKAERRAAVPAAQAYRPAPQPPGAAPAGKVWSTEHGHWHDATTGSAPAAAAGMPANALPGNALPGGAPRSVQVTGVNPGAIQVSSQQVPVGTNPSTTAVTPTFPQPPGEVPPGKVWSREHGHWHDIQ